MGNDVLKVINLTKKYKKNSLPVINNLNFTVGKGEFHAFIGGNGAGKTTTIKSIIGVYNNFSGEILINGVSNRNWSSRNNLGYIPEIARFPSRLSSYDYLYYMSLLSGKNKIESKNIVEKLLHETNMWKLRNHCPNNFSSGQKKKILLAQALVNDPLLLVMDEPAANLDPRARIDFFDTLKKLKESGKTIFISSHILSELNNYADALTILDDGKIVLSGKRSEISLDNNSYTYKIKITKKDKYPSFLKEYKIIDGEFTCSFKNKNDIYQIIEKLSKYKLLEEFKTQTCSIEDLYKKFVIYGSVQTK